MDTKKVRLGKYDVATRHHPHFKRWIPATIRALRGNRTLKQIADASGLSVSYLSDIERGHTIPTIESLDKIFTSLGVTLTIGYEETTDVSSIKSEWIFVRKSALREIVESIREIDPDAMWDDDND